ncbi:hypothetical protein [Halobacillus sp. Marseille-Q1614]|uniref:hypothetical protein n=1 Tax=Halobacillus sp. Marseille-Q1614 TaxID=2709134 RepID=UPI00156DCB8F|nr:hypothetical protein [Halobacillus sp. Marseille-Q1614]
MSTVWKWSIGVIIIVLLLIGTAVFSIMKYTNDRSEEASLQKIEETFKSENTSHGEGNSETKEMSFEGSVQEFVAEAHNFYNQTLGWGRDEGLDEDLHLEFADLIQRYLKSHSTDQINTEDIQSINELAASLTTTPDFREKVIQLHRYFHDLDIAVNDYEDYDKVWGVTKTLKNE